MGTTEPSARSARTKGLPRAQRKRLIATTALALCLALAAPEGARAQSETTNFNLPAQSLKSALLSYSAQSKVQIVIPDELVEGKNAPALVGVFTNEQGLSQLLTGSGLRAEFTSPRAVKLLSSAKESERASLRPKRSQVVATKQQSDLGSPQVPEEVVVTGTRIRGAAPVGSEVISINRASIESSGYVGTADIIHSVPQATLLGAQEEVNGSRAGAQNATFNTTFGASANLRGLGPDATLTLINGRRVAPAGAGTFVDISAIPLSAVERIEVVADGASAIYGSDAIGGVVNIILRRNFDGAETSGQLGRGDGFTTYQASQIIGRKWDTGSAFVGVEYYKRQNLPASKREYFTNDLRVLGGSDFRLAFSNPGTIAVGSTTYAIPKNQNGHGLSASQLVANTSNLQDQLLSTDILPQQRRKSAVLSVEQEVSDRARVFFEGTFTSRAYRQRNPANTATISVPRSNPFFVGPSPTATTVSVRYSFLQDLGPTVFTGTAKNYAATVGGEVDLFSSWKAQAFASYARDGTKSLSEQYVNSFYLRQAAASSDPNIAFNPFGDGSNSSQAAIERITGWSSNFRRTTLKTINAQADGGLFDIPGGTVRLALGGEYQTSKLAADPVSFLSAATPTPSATTRLGRKVTAGFGELYVPIFGAANELSFVKILEFTVAGRVERYSDFGYTSNPKLGVRWMPASDLSFRGSYGTSFLAPLFIYGDQNSSTYFFSSLPDPKSRTGTTTNTLILFGGNPDLKPQTATTWSVGAEYSPKFLDGLSLQATYYSVAYTNRILDAASSVNGIYSNEDVYASRIIRNPTAAQLAPLYASPFFTNFGGIPQPPSAVGGIVDLRFRNLGSVTTRGIDFLAAYGFDTSVGRFDLQSNIGAVTSYEVAQSPTAPKVEMVGTINNPVQIRMRNTISWRFAGYGVTSSVNYTGSYLNNSVAPAQSVSSRTTVDLQLRYAPEVEEQSDFSRMVFAISFVNLFNAHPPFVNNATGFGYDPQNATSEGRTVFLKVSKKW